MRIEEATGIRSKELQGWNLKLKEVVDKILTVVYTLVIMNDITVLNVKISKSLKKQAQETARALGLPVSTLVTASLKEIVRNRSITISDEPKLSKDVEDEILKISRNAKKGIGVSPVFDNIEESFKWLDKEAEKH